MGVCFRNRYYIYSFFGGDREIVILVSSELHGITLIQKIISLLFFSFLFTKKKKKKKKKKPWMYKVLDYFFLLFLVYFSPSATFSDFF